ncbi:MAG: hypothetical protein K8R10_08165 [Rhodocyclales bacterium]|nr:hypothetical protein [Rhodocyclales bacterium]
MNLRDLHSIGIPGLVGIGLFLFCGSLYLNSVVPMRAQLDAANNEALRLRETLGKGTPVTDPTAHRDANASAAEAKPVADPIEIIRRLNTAAESSTVMVDRASYTVIDKDGGRRIEVSLPTKGSYKAIRSYLNDALAVGRGAQIDSLVLQRGRATEPMLDADLKLSFELDPK